MRQLLAGILVVAVIGGVIAGCGSVAARTGAAPARTGVAQHRAAGATQYRAAGATQHHAAAVKADPRLKRRLGAEIRTLRGTRPKVTRIAKTAHATVIPENGRTCFIADGCSNAPCREFARAPAVYRRTSGPVGALRRGKPSRPVCLPAPRELVSGP